MKYFDTTNFMKKLIDKLDKSMYDNINYFLTLNAQLEFHEKSNMLFRIGDIGEKFYIILEGTVDVLKPKQIVKKLTVIEYLIYLYNIKKNNEIYIYENIINANVQTLFIKDRLFNKLIEFISFVNSESNSSPEILNSLDKNDYDYDDLLEYYSIIKENKSYNFFLEEYETIIQLCTCASFGDFALESTNRLRTASIQMKTDCYFAVIKQQDYCNYLLNEKKKSKMKEFKFLYESFFHRTFEKEKFEKFYFTEFIFQEFRRGHLLDLNINQEINQVISSKINDEINCESNINNTVTNLYLIKEGQIEISLNKNMIELFKILQMLIKCHPSFNSVFDIETFGEYFNKKLKTNLKELSKKRNLSIMKIGEKDILGIEEFYFKLPFLFQAKVVSEKVCLYKLTQEGLNKMMEREGIGKKFMKEHVFMKITNKINRLSNLNKTFLKIIDNEIEEIKNLFNKKIKNENKKKVFIEEDPNILHKDETDKRIINKNIFLQDKTIGIQKSLNNIITSSPGTNFIKKNLEMNKNNPYNSSQGKKNLNLEFSFPGNSVNSGKNTKSEKTNLIKISNFSNNITNDIKNSVNNHNIIEKEISKMSHLRESNKRIFNINSEKNIYNVGTDDIIEESKDQIKNEFNKNEINEKKNKNKKIKTEINILDYLEKKLILKNYENDSKNSEILEESKMNNKTKNKFKENIESYTYKKSIKLELNNQKDHKNYSSIKLSTINPNQSNILINSQIKENSNPKKIISSKKTYFLEEPLSHQFSKFQQTLNIESQKIKEDFNLKKKDSFEYFCKKNSNDSGNKHLSTTNLKLGLSNVYKTFEYNQKFKTPSNDKIFYGKTTNEKNNLSKNNYYNSTSESFSENESSNNDELNLKQNPYKKFKKESEFDDILRNSINTFFSFKNKTNNIRDNDKKIINESKTINSSNLISENQITNDKKLKKFLNENKTKNLKKNLNLEFLKSLYSKKNSRNFNLDFKNDKSFFKNDHINRFTKEDLSNMIDNFSMREKNVDFNETAKTKLNENKEIINDNNANEYHEKHGFDNYNLNLNLYLNLNLNAKPYNQQKLTSINNYAYKNSKSILKKNAYYDKDMKKIKLGNKSISSALKMDNSTFKNIIDEFKNKDIQIFSENINNDYDYILNKNYLNKVNNNINNSKLTHRINKSIDNFSNIKIYSNDTPETYNSSREKNTDYFFNNENTPRSIVEYNINTKNKIGIEQINITHSRNNNHKNNINDILKEKKYIYQNLTTINKNKEKLQNALIKEEFQKNSFSMRSFDFTDAIHSLPKIKSINNQKNEINDDKIFIPKCKNFSLKKYFTKKIKLN